MSHYVYNTENVCAQTIEFDLEAGAVRNIRFFGGCNGNLKAIAKLVEGWTPQQIESALAGNTCGRRPTSCADQLAKAVHLALAKEGNSC